MTGSKSTTNTINGVTATRNVLPSGDGLVTKERTLAAAKTGTLTTRTSTTVGTLTATTGHGITTAARLDVYWAGGSRVGVVVGTVATDSIPITGGSGDDLPAAAMALTLMVPVLESFPITVANLASIICVCDAPGIAAVVDGALAALGSFRPTSSVAGAEWDSSSGITNPISANSTSVYLSHGDSTASRQIQILALVS